MTIQQQRTFVDTSRAWYRDTAPENYRNDIIVMVNAPGTSGCELIFRPDERVPDRKSGQPSWRLMMYDENWSAFVLAPDLFAKLAEIADKPSSKEQLVAAIEQCGFADTTEENRPQRLRERE